MRAAPAAVLAVRLAAALALGLVAALGAALAGAPSARAQDVSWLEERGSGIVVLYGAGDEEARDAASDAVRPLYEVLAEAFQTQLPEPLTLRVHPTLASYMRSNPLLVETDGLLAGTRRGRREIEIVTPTASVDRTAALDRALRREIARLLVTEATDDRLPDGLLEGAARFLERPDEANAAEVARLRDAFSRNGLYRWSDIAAPGSAYLDPRVAQPQSRSVVHFLVDAYGFPAFRRFLAGSAEAASWRIALEAAYGVAPDKLETAWLQWLPAYLDGGWQRHPLYSTDLAAVEALIDSGDFAGAEERLSVAAPLLSEENEEAGAHAQALLRQARSGADAVAQLAEAAASLDAGDYGDAASLAASAERDLAALGQDDAARAGGEIARHARIGLSAEADMRRANQLPAWRATEARLLASAAAAGFAQLGNDASADKASSLVSRVDRRLLPAGYALLVLGGLLLAWNVRRRLTGDQREAHIA